LSINTLKLENLDIKTAVESVQLSTDSFGTPRAPRYKSLDTWRGVACLLVVIYHSTFYEGFQLPTYIADDLASGIISKMISFMWSGVTIFFVISGYCITATMDATRRKPRAVKKYFFRRFKRIYPPYWIFIGLSAVLVLSLYNLGWPQLLTETSYSIPHTSSLSWLQWAGNLTLTESWRFHLFGDSNNFFMNHAWTLCYEEQFYAVCGAVLFLAPSRFFRIMIAISVFTFLIRFFSSTFNIPVLGFFFDGRFLSFALGILIYYQINYALEYQSRFILLLLLIGTLTVLILEYWVELPESKWRFEMLISLLFASALSLLHKWDLQIYSSKLLKPITFCGFICYSLYLIHVPVVKLVSHLLQLYGFHGSWITIFITIPVSTLAAVAVSWLFHLAVERHFLNKPQI
jgi:peptidoglycan/LPS O-acetylase OafA/YrhL